MPERKGGIIAAYYFETTVLSGLFRYFHATNNASERCVYQLKTGAAVPALDQVDEVEHHHEDDRDVDVAALAGTHSPTGRHREALEK